jgi:hypothetical protein
VKVPVPLAVAFMAGQFVHTLMNRNWWPFASFNMFSFSCPDTPRRRLAILVTASGECVGPIPAWRLLPLEYFRVDALMKECFQGARSTQRRAAVASHVLQRVNAGTWRAWDEIKESPPPAASPYVGVEFHLVHVDLDSCDLSNSQDILSRELLYRFDPEGRFATSRQYAQLMEAW